LALDCRVAYAPRNDDPGDLKRRIEAGQSALFASCWRDQDVLGREGGERKFTHPLRGELHFRQTTLLVASRPEIKLVCLTGV
jgi:hypothetical protein